MAQVGSIVTTKAIGILRAESGLAFSVAEISHREGIQLAPVPAAHIIAENVPFELFERSVGARYPALHVYCDRVVNDLKEKFRTFSGKAHVAIEVRISQDRLEGLERQLQLYVDAATWVIDVNRGDWGNGMFYGGGYEIQFGPAKHGGKNFIKTAKIVFAVDVSIN